MLFLNCNLFTFLNLVISVSFFIITLVVIIYCVSHLSQTQKSVCIVVLGDIGRSPRMQYHALSFAKNKWSVSLIGYGGSEPHNDVVVCRNIRLYIMQQCPDVFKVFPRLLLYVVKTCWQAAVLLYCMLRVKRPSHVLLQNPPAIPSLFVAWLVSRIRRCKLVIDWHNYGYTILGLTLGEKHPLVKFAKWYERLTGRLASYNLCVTNAMKLDLANNWNIQAVTMYDRPPSMFKEAAIDVRHALFKKLSGDYTVFCALDNSLANETIFTQRSPSGEVMYRRQRPALVVSSTSWTEDEDFSVLLEALDKYDCCSSGVLPDILCVITGKGPLKDYYISEIDRRKWNHVKVCTPWLEAEDYPVLLGSADVGVCLHTSSSGLDLPMKVVDMFGCGLPVCAVHFNCLHELVKHEENGLVFRSSEELVNQFKILFSGFPQKQDKLQLLRKNLKVFQNTRWDQSWKENVLPLFF